MVRNLSREFATMTDDERRRFALERGGTSGGPEGEAAADELDLEDPRPDRMGRQYADANAETADPDARDGEAALLDDAEHERRVNDERHSRKGG
jgi:hypothetical protein